MFYMVVNKNTGEMDDNCGRCSIGIVAGYKDFEAFNLDDSHMIVEISYDEFEVMNSSVKYKIIEDGKEVVLDDFPLDILAEPFYSKKLDVTKVKTKLDDRLKIDIPIEIDGIGGKEIIGYERKPESIVTERNK